MRLSKYDQFYIDVIRFGIKKIDCGIAKKELKDHMASKGYKLQDKAHFFNEMVSQLFQPQLNNNSRDNNEKLTIKSEAFFNLIQYKSNKKTEYAFYIAAISLILTTATLIFPKFPLLNTLLSCAYDKLN